MAAMNDAGRPSCYPVVPARALEGAPPGSRLPWLDVLTSPVPSGRFDSPVDHRHVLCLHVGGPVPVSYRAERAERRGTRLHGQFCVVPAGSSTRWTLSAPATSLLLRLAPEMMRQAADAMRLGVDASDPAPAIHVRDPQIERIGWMMRSEALDGYPSGRLFADSLACALAARVLAAGSRRSSADAHLPRLPGQASALPAWRLQRVVDYIEAHLDEDLSLADLAAVASYSVSHFKPLFKNAVGMPAHRFVMHRRVERARLLLTQGDLDITGIALATGFAHPSHMARCMRRMLGVSPSQLAATRATIRG